MRKYKNPSLRANISFISFYPVFELNQRGTKIDISKWRQIVHLLKNCAIFFPVY